MTQQTYAVMGLDKSGLASVQHLLAQGSHVLAWDDNPQQFERAKALGAQITDLTQGSYDCPLVLTPGIGLKHPIALRFKEIIGDIELFARANPHARVIGITGTNGKSTTSALIHHILVSAGINAQIGGNFGTSPLALPAADIYVLELSSYQLERCPSLKVEVGVMLNLTPDHLDRHGDMKGYAAAKANLFGTHLGNAVYGVDDSWTKAMGEAAVSYGWKGYPILVPPDGNYDDAFDLHTLPRLPGSHNWQNAVAAILTCRAVGLSDDKIRAGLISFPGLAHRQQLVAEQHGIRFINDSKATNADATSKALGCYENIYWIIGGRAKAGGLDGLESYMPRIRKAFLIGEAANDFARWLEGKATYELCGDLKTATLHAAAAAKADKLEGAVVLLSPACASLDQFKNYEERGEQFAALARNLLQEQVA